MISITIDNGSNNNVGRSCYSAHQAVSKFIEDHIDIVSYAHPKCQTRGDVLAHINESFECVTASS